MRWAEITVEATAASADAISNIFLEEGCAGTAYLPPNPLPTREGELKLPSPPRGWAGGGVNVMGYLPVDDRLENALHNIRDQVGRLTEFGLDIRSEEIGVKWVQEEEWASAWKKFFKPLHIGRVVIKPSWEDFEPKDGDVVVDIDPGMAFGTGHHPTTRLCLLALQDLIRGREAVLDVGTGSGILAIAAAGLGAERVTALEIDPVAVEIAMENVGRSGLEHVVEVRRADSPREFNGEADIVLANIIAKVIIDMADDLRAKVAPGGRLVTSGIVRERAVEVIEKLESVGMKTLEVREDGEWAAVISSNS